MDTITPHTHARARARVCVLLGTYCAQQCPQHVQHPSMYEKPEAASTVLGS
jgi:hypothetical protein